MKKRSDQLSRKSREGQYAFFQDCLWKSQNGFLFEKENTEDLLEKLQMLYENRIKLDPDALVADYRARFTLEAQISALMKILEINE